MINGSGDASFHRMFVDIWLIVNNFNLKYGGLFIKYLYFQFKKTAWENAISHKQVVANGGKFFIAVDDRTALPWPRNLYEHFSLGSRDLIDKSISR